MCLRHIEYSSLISKASIILSFLIITFAGIHSNNADPDLWGYMAFGRLYWETGKFPYHDVFTYLPSLDIWVYHEWLSGVLFYAIYRFLGESALILMRYGLAFLTTIFIYLIARQRGASPVFSIIILFFGGGFLALGFGTVIRAQTFTYLFFAITLFLLERYRDNVGLRYLLILIAVNLLWCNLHGGFISGLGLIAIYGVGRALSGYSYRYHLIVLVLSILLTLINPYGLEYWIYTFRAIMMPRLEITEWASIYKSFRLNLISLWVLFYFHIIILISIRWIHYARWKKITQIAVLLITGLLGILHIRHMVFFQIAVSAYLGPLAEKYFAGMEFNPTFGPILAFIRNKKRNLYFFALMIVLVFCLMPKSLSLEIPAFPTQGKGFYYPVYAIDYIHKNKITGNILTEFHWGEFVIWTSHSLLKVGFDGRYETVYPSHVAKEYFDFDAGKNREYLDKYPHQFALLAPNTKGLKFIKNSPDWEQLYCDSGSFLFAHRLSVQGNEK
jgi:hypothetical protein